MRGLMQASFVWLVILGAAGAWAGWASVPISTLVADSDLAIVGVLSEIHERKEDRSRRWECAQVLSEGKIAVEEVVFGPAEIGQALRLKWADGCSNGEDLNHKEHANRRTIWLLKRSADGSVHADYPWRLIRLCEGDLKTVRKVLAQLKPSQGDERLERLASIVKRAPEYECKHHLWEGNW